MNTTLFDIYHVKFFNKVELSVMIIIIKSYKILHQML